MSLQFSSDEPDAFPLPEIVPIFPLPTVVFFPKTYLPLHIFEARYREMIQDASAEGQCIGMALLKDGWGRTNTKTNHRFIPLDAWDGLLALTNFQMVGIILSYRAYNGAPIKSRQS